MMLRQVVRLVGRALIVWIGLAAIVVALATIVFMLATSLLSGRSDSGESQDRRVAIVEMIRAGILQAEDDGWVRLPDELAAASRSDRGVAVWSEPSLTVFFLTGTGLSPDPYCGYEYTENDEPRGDPLASGSNKELEALGGGWYWLCAS